MNGRFIDPCSGDEWELNGTLNLQHSPELWNNRNLDRYRVEIQGEAIVVHLGEIIRAEPVVDDPHYGTRDNPQTDLQTVTEHVAHVAGRSQAALAEQSGWLHVYAEEFRPAALRSDTGLMQALFPTDQMFAESWYRASGDSRFDQSLTRYLDADGNMTQVSVLIDERYVNLTLNDVSNASDPTLPLPNPTAFVVERLREASRFTENALDVTAYLTTADDRTLYFIHLTITHAQPLEIIERLDQPVAAQETTYTIDFDSGRTVAQEEAVITSAGERIITWRTQTLVEEWQTAVPDEVAALLAQGEEILSDSDNAPTGSYTWDAPTPTPDPNPAPVLAGDSRQGITVTVIDVAGNDTETTVTAVALVEPLWQMNVNAFPPQQALLREIALQGDGKPFTVTSSAGKPAQMVTGGGLRQGAMLTFTGDTAGVSEWSLQATVDLSLLHRVITLPVTLAGSEVGQTWPLDWPLPLGAADLRLTEVMRLEDTAAGDVQLQVTVVDGSPPGIEIYCVYLARTDPWQRTCANFSGEKTFVIATPPDAPVTLHLRANLEVGPFDLRWAP